MQSKLLRKCVNKPPNYAQVIKPPTVKLTVDIAIRNVD